MLDIQVGQDGKVALVGRLDAAESTQALERLEQLPGPITLECSGLEYISSAGISVIMVTYKRMAASGQKLVFENMPPRVKKVFEYAGLATILGIS